MSETPSELSPDIEQQFVELASELCNHFPDIDLRFNLLEGSNTVRCFAPEITEDGVEFDLDDSRSTEIVYEAIFAIKELTQLFDA